jgi:hypothetical protein
MKQVGKALQSRKGTGEIGGRLSAAEVGLPTAPVARINALHARLGTLRLQIQAAGEDAVAAAMEIGKLLLEQKEQIGHGEWIPWVEKNLRFGVREVQRYCRIWNQRAVLNKGVSNATTLSPLRMLEQIAEPREAAPRADTRDRRKSALEGPAPAQEGQEEAIVDAEAEGSLGRILGALRARESAIRRTYQNGERAARLEEIGKAIDLVHRELQGE